MNTIKEIRNARKERRNEFVKFFETGDRFQQIAKNYLRGWRKVSFIASLICDSFANKITCSDGRSDWFDILPKKDQYLIVKRLAEKLDDENLYRIV